MRRCFTVMAALLFAGSAVGVRAQEMDPLLKLLIENKVITQEQAVAVQAQYDQQKRETKEQAKQVATEVVSQAKPDLGVLKGLSIGGTYYLSYQNGIAYSAASPSADRTDAYNKFTLKRGYLDVQKEITPWFKTRFTPDITQDSNGQFNLRMKYFFADFHWKGNDFISSPHIEVGMCHNPWLDFEESINVYRMQDTMFLERNGIFASADLGVMFGANFGPPLPKSYQDEVSKSYPGRWGSFQVGLYNGGNYTAAERNTNKAAMVRFTLRPLPDYLPGLQLSWLGISGKENLTPTDATKVPWVGKRIYPDWRLSNWFLSYQHEHFTLTGQYYTGRGNSSGSAIYTDKDYVPGKVDPDLIYTARRQKGYSYFGEVKFPGSKKWSLMARYDHFDPDTEGVYDVQHKHDIQDRTIVGVAYRLYKNNIVLFDYDLLKHKGEYLDTKSGLYKRIPDEGRFQLTLQIKF